MRLKEVGEDPLIERLKKDFAAAHPRILKAIGDDAAVVAIDRKRCILTTTDTLVEGVHFSPRYSPPYLLGRKAVSISLSDIAAMGGSPFFFLLSVALKSSVTLEFFNELYRGVRDCAAEAGVFLVGGNTSEAPSETVITSTMIGEAPKDEIVYRSGARAGDVIYLTGTAGDAALGLEVLKRSGPRSIAKGAFRGPFKNAVERHLNPTARVRAGRFIARKKLATAMIDTSDGLMRDLRRLSVESRVGAMVELKRLPLSKAMGAYIKCNPRQRHLPLHGGEDYELLFTAAEARGPEVASLGKKLGVRITAIGRVLARSAGVRVFDEYGSCVPLDREGYEHFR
ncbi:MAG: thiamine-phosphate kinase [Deltaproteobacteria bacterium]|nr:thiamine-phosphate kinase [Deltaproteobacteria bacterium]